MQMQENPSVIISSMKEFYHFPALETRMLREQGDSIKAGR
jgi:hypothetical protein